VSIDVFSVALLLVPALCALCGCVYLFGVGVGQRRSDDRVRQVRHDAEHAARELRVLSAQAFAAMVEEVILRRRGLR
jgi:hypothetical protein